MATTSLVLWGLVLVPAVFAGSALRGRKRERVLILGCGSLASKLWEEGAASETHDLLGIVGEATPSAPSALQSHIVGSLAGLAVTADALRPDRIVIALAERRGSLPVRQLLELRMRGISIERGEDFYERLSGKVAIEALAPGDLVFAQGFRRTALDRTLGRMLSVTLSAAALIMASPLLLLIGIAILLDSGAPLLFDQDRVGLHGRRFRLLKFRTMRPANGTTSEWACDNEHRITRVGRWLRRFRLDELPQLLNVLRGDMNFIGPRPHPVSSFELLTTVARNTSDRCASLPYYALRCSIRPGITGWAQVRYGYANNLEEELEKLRYDLYYVRYRTLGLDLRIVIDTLRTVLWRPDAKRSGPAGATPWNAGTRLAQRPLPSPLVFLRMTIRRMSRLPYLAVSAPTSLDSPIPEASARPEA